MTIYDQTYRLKVKIIIGLALLLIVSLIVDHWVLLIVDNFLTGFIPLFKKIEQISDSLTNNLSVSFLVVSSIGVLISSLYFKNQKWSTFFISWIIVFVGAAFITNYLKITLGRIRPEEINGIDHGLKRVHYWFAKGDSFPSGHASYYFSLFFPMYYYFDRLKLVLVIPIIIALGRVIQKAHFLSDILMSIWIVMTLVIVTDLILTWIVKEIKKFAERRIKIKN